MDEQIIKKIVSEVLLKYSKCGKSIPVECSARHIHLSRQHTEQLFGSGYKLTPERELSQPGQFLCKERVRLVGPSGTFDNVAILGPERNETQIELTATDARTLGISTPVRISGDLSGAADLIVYAGNRFINAIGSAIIAKNHIHMSPKDAEQFSVIDKDKVRIQINSERPLIFDEVLVRINENYSLAMHIDFDEANACAWIKGMSANILIPGSNFVNDCNEITLQKHKESYNPNVGIDFFWKGRVINEIIAKEFRDSGKQLVWIAKGTLITPLAKDIIRSAKIIVDYKENEAIL